MDNGYITMSLMLVPSGNALLGEEEPVDSEPVTVRKKKGMKRPEFLWSISEYLYSTRVYVYIANMGCLFTLTEKSSGSDWF